MKVKMYIPTVDDSNNRYTTSFLFRSTVKIYKYGNNLNQFGEYEIRVHKIYGRKDTLDPTYDSIESALKSHLFPTHLQLATKLDNLTCIITFKYKDGNSTIVIQKSKPHFFLNGSRQNKSIVIGNVARIIYRSCFECSSRTMDKYISRLLLFPPNVTYAIENRTEFNYYIENGVPIKVRINTRPISDVKCALEISDGIWGGISIPELNSFINYHRFGHRRSQKWGISPKFLWANLMGKLPTSGQEKLMLEFLQQNRTQDIVEQRAEQLLNELEL